MHSSLPSLSVLKCVGRNFARKPISHPRSLTDIWDVVMAQEVSSEFEEARWFHPWNRRKCNFNNWTNDSVIRRTNYPISQVTQEATKWRNLMPTDTSEWRPEELGSPVRGYTTRSETSLFLKFWFRTSAETVPTTIPPDLINKTWNIPNDNEHFLPAVHALLNGRHVNSASDWKYQRFPLELKC
jgi:hypothetical protein